MMNDVRPLVVAVAVALCVSGVGAASRLAARQGSGQSATQQQQQQPPTSTTQSQATPTEGQGRNGAAARQALLQARDSLTEVTTMPEASRLQGQARTNVVEIINTFNGLLTAESDWYEQYQDVDRRLASMLGLQSDTTAGTSGSASGEATGTAGSSTAGVDIPPAIRTKLVEFRQHLAEFARAAGAPGAGASHEQGSGSDLTGQSGTSGTSGSSPSQSSETLDQHIDAISDLIQQSLSQSASAETSGASTTGSGTEGTAGTSGSTSASRRGTVTLDRATIDQIQSHLQRLRELAKSKGVK